MKSPRCSDCEMGCLWSCFTKMNRRHSRSPLSCSSSQKPPPLDGMLRPNGKHEGKSGVNKEVFPGRLPFGRTVGSFGVSQIGSAQYSIPIWAPPGPKGLQPTLALSYDSASDIGPLGIGWSLAGLG